MSSHKDLAFAQKIWDDIQHASSTTADEGRPVRMIAASLAEARRLGRQESLDAHQACGECGRRWYIDYDGMWTMDHKTTCRRINVLSPQKTKSLQA